MPYELYIYGDNEPVKLSEGQYNKIKVVLEQGRSRFFDLDGNMIATKTVKALNSWGEQGSNIDVSKLIESTCSHCGYAYMANYKGRKCPECWKGVMGERKKHTGDAFYEEINGFESDNERVTFVEEQQQLGLILPVQAQLAKLYIKSFLHNKPSEGVLELAKEVFNN